MLQFPRADFLHFRDNPINEKPIGVKRSEMC